MPIGRRRTIAAISRSLGMRASRAASSRACDRSGVRRGRDGRVSVARAGGGVSIRGAAAIDRSSSAAAMRMARRMRATISATLNVPKAQAMARVSSGVAYDRTAARCWLPMSIRVRMIWSKAAERDGFAGAAMGEFSLGGGALWTGAVGAWFMNVE